MKLVARQFPVAPTMEDLNNAVGVLTSQRFDRLLLLKPCVHLGYTPWISPQSDLTQTRSSISRDQREWTSTNLGWSYVGPYNSLPTDERRSCARWNTQWSYSALGSDRRPSAKDTSFSALPMRFRGGRAAVR